MIYVADGKIYLTRGDDGTLDVSIKDEAGTAYTMQPGDKLTLTVRPAPSKTAAKLMQCVSTSSSIVITHEDSDIPAGAYSADIQLTKQYGDIITVYPDEITGKAANFKNFIIGAEVT